MKYYGQSSCIILIISSGVTASPPCQLMPLSVSVPSVFHLQLLGYESWSSHYHFWNSFFFLLLSFFFPLQSPSPLPFRECSWLTWKKKKKKVLCSTIVSVRLEVFGVVCNHLFEKEFDSFWKGEHIKPVLKTVWQLLSVPKCRHSAL